MQTKDEFLNTVKEVLWQDLREFFLSEDDYIKIQQHDMIDKCNNNPNQKIVRLDGECFFWVRAIVWGWNEGRSNEQDKISEVDIIPYFFDVAQASCSCGFFNMYRK